MKKILILLVAVVAVGAAGVTAWFTLTGPQEVDVRGTCGSSTYELSTDEEDNGYDLEFTLRSAAPGESWNVEVQQDGATVLSSPRTTDEDSELDVVVPIDSKAGTKYQVTATPTTGEACVVSAAS